MASAGLGKELDCSICLTLYTNSVSLGCGHNFCWACIDQVLNTQDESGVYSCPECREEFLKRPALKRNITLCNVEENFQPTKAHQEEVIGIQCTHYVDFPIWMNKLSMKIRDIEDLRNITDPLTVLQEPDTGDLCDPEEEGSDEDTGGHDGGDEDTGGHDKTHDLNVDVIAGMLHAGFPDIMTYLPTISSAKPKEMRPQPPSTRSLPSHTQDLPLSGTEYGGDDVIVRTGGAGRKVTAVGNGGIYGEGPADILLDVNTAANDILISDDLKTATWITLHQNHPRTASKFPNCQVISSSWFFTGRHYWDVDISGSNWWKVGACYPSINRRGSQPCIGYNKKSWCLCKGLWYNDQYLVHDSNVIQLPHQISSDRVRICLDYKAGQLSFYELCDPIRHLHTFTATFSEPLHAVLCVYHGSIKILRGKSSSDEPSS